MKRVILKFSIWMVSLFMPLVVFAEQGYGDIADNIFGNEVVIRDIIRAICITTGAGLIFGSLLQLRKHYKNPNEVTMSTPIVSFLAGLALIGLSFIPIQV